jgi:hypothetical protein
VCGLAVQAGGATTDHDTPIWDDGGMGDGTPGPIDVDVTEIEPGAFARLLISRGVSGNDMAWAENHWDVATRYPRNADLVNVLVGIIDQLLTELAVQRGMTSAQLWQELMLREAAAEADGA